MLNICQIYAEDTQKICQRYVKDMPQICQRYAKDMPKIYETYYNAQQCEIGRKYGFISLYTV